MNTCNSKAICFLRFIYSTLFRNANNQKRAKCTESDHYCSGPGCSKLVTSLVNVALRSSLIRVFIVLLVLIL